MQTTQEQEEFRRNIMPYHSISGLSVRFANLSACATSGDELSSPHPYSQSHKDKTMLALVSTAADDEQQTVSFTDFWAMYPKRICKKDATKAWLKLSPVQQKLAIVSLYQWRQVWIERDEYQFIPNASTWLNGERWEDEIPASHNNNQQFQQPIDNTPVNYTIPAHVMAAIAKFRGSK
jgi:hypothetical protein